MNTKIKNKDVLKYNPYQLALLEDLLTNSKPFFNSEKFNDKNFCNKLMSYQGPDIDTTWFFNHLNSLDGINKGAYSKSTTLTTKQETLLFLKYNYIKKLIDSLARLNEPESYQRLMELHDLANVVKDKLVGANLGLVLNIARTNTFSNVDFTDAISEGNIELVNAVETFDINKGTKFSTFFTTVLHRALIKVNNANGKVNSNSVEYDHNIHDKPEEENEVNTEFLNLISEFISGDTELLSEDERFVLTKKYVEGLTLSEIGKFYNPIKTKGQVFYVEKTARLKIKDVLIELL